MLGAISAFGQERARTILEARILRSKQGLKRVLKGYRGVRFKCSLEVAQKLRRELSKLQAPRLGLRVNRASS